MIIKSHGIQSRFLQKLNEFYGIQVRQSRFFSGQQNLLVFNCDFSLLLKCLLIFVRIWCTFLKVSRIY
jgi:hypothetical protein